MLLFEWCRYSYQKGICLLNSSCGPKLPLTNHLMNQCIKIWFHNVDTPTVNRFDSFDTDVNTNDSNATTCDNGGRRQSNITKANH